MYERTLRVMPSDVSCRGTIKLRSILDYFQDTAGLAVEDIEGTSMELYSRGYAWVLMKYEIDIHGNLPVLDEEFTLRTYHDPSHGYNTLRMFHSHFVTAKTSWLLVDVKSGRPVKPTAHIPEIASKDTQSISPDFEELTFPDEAAHTYTHTVKYHDTDYNGHVNNAIYFQWLYDNAPVDVMKVSPVKLKAVYRSGAKLGETVTLKFSQDNNITSCRVMRPNIDKPCALMSCEWRQD